MERMVGPADFAMNDESGVLIEGFELRPMIRQPWHPPYYQQRIEQAGMTKAMDLLMWNLEVADRAKVLPVIFELAEKVQSEHGIRVRPMRRRQLRKDMDAFAEVYNSAWSENWDFVPYSKKDLDAYAQELQLAFDKHWAFIAEREDTGEVVGMAMTFPDLNQVLAKMNGRLLPLGWWHFLRKGSSSTACASASSASSPSTSTPASRRSSTSNTSTPPPRARRAAARWAGSSRRTRR